MKVSSFDVDEMFKKAEEGYGYAKTCLTYWYKRSLQQEIEKSQRRIDEDELLGKDNSIHYRIDSHINNYMSEWNFSRNYFALLCIGWCYEYELIEDPDSSRKAFEFYELIVREGEIQQLIEPLFYDEIQEDKFIRRKGTQVKEEEKEEKEKEKEEKLSGKITVSTLSEAYRLLGLCYSDGIGVAKDHQKAIYNYQKAIELGNYFAMVSYGSACEEGEGTEANLTEAYRWSLLACQLPNHPIHPTTLEMNANSLAVDNLGIFHQDDNYFELADESKAIFYFSKAVKLENADGYYDLATLYETGIIAGVEEENLKIADELYKKAARIGMKLAQDRLKELGLEE